MIIEEDALAFLLVSPMTGLFYRADVDNPSRPLAALVPLHNRSGFFVEEENLIGPYSSEHQNHRDDKGDEPGGRSEKLQFYSARNIYIGDKHEQILSLIHI